MRNVFRLPLLLSPLLVLSMGCVGVSPRGAGSRTGAVVDACATATKLRERVPPFLASGRLDRTVRILHKANQLCPNSAPTMWATEVQTLAHLSRCSEARALAATILTAPLADQPSKTAAHEAQRHCDDVQRQPADMAVARQQSKQLHADGLALAERTDDDSLRMAQEKFMAAWHAFRPNPEALVGAGLVAKRRLQDRQSQELFDRALAEAERLEGKTVKLDVLDGFGDAENRGVSSIAWSHDSRRLAVAHAKEISILDRSLRENLRIRGHTHHVTTVAFSPDGKTIASGSYGNTVRIWNASTGERVRKLVGHTKSITFVTYSPDGKTLASASRDNTIRLWEVATGKQLALLAGHTDDVFRVVYSPNGKTLASISEDQSVRLWDAVAGTEIQILDEKARIYYEKTIAFSPDGKTIRWAASTDRGEKLIREWDLETKKIIESIPQPSEREKAFEPSPDGTLRAVIEGIGVELWDVASDKRVQVTEAHARSFHSLAYSKDGQTLAATTDQRVHTWTLGIQRTYRTSDWISTPMPLGPGPVRIDLLLERMYQTGHELDYHAALDVAADGKFVAFGLKENVIGLFDIASHEMIRTFDAQAQAPVEIDVSPDNKVLASRLEDGTIQLWDLATGTKLRTLDKLAQDSSHSWQVLFSPNSKTMATVSKDALWVWDVATGSVVQRFTPEKEPWQPITFSPDGQTLAVRGDRKDKRVHLLDVTTGKPRLTLGKRVELVQFSPDGKTLLGGAKGHQRRIWDATTGKELRKLVGVDGDLWNTEYTPNGRFIAAIDDHGSLDLFDADAGKLVATVRALPLNEIRDEDRGAEDERDPEASYVFTPSGHIDIMGKDACAVRQYPVCHIGTMAFPFDVCEERLLVPGLLAKVHHGDSSYLEPDAVPLMMDCNNIPTH